MKATPIKGKERRANCESCSSWMTGEPFTAYLVREDQQVHESTYSSSRFYYSGCVVSTLYRCSNCGDVLINTDDGDEQDIIWKKHDLWWECSECNCIHEEKEDADACCN